MQGCCPSAHHPETLLLPPIPMGMASTQAATNPGGKKQTPKHPINRVYYRWDDSRQRDWSGLLEMKLRAELGLKSSYFSLSTSSSLLKMKVWLFLAIVQGHALLAAWNNLFRAFWSPHVQSTCTFHKTLWYHWTQCYVWTKRRGGKSPSIITC